LSATHKFFILQFATANPFFKYPFFFIQTAETIRTHQVAYNRRSTRSTSSGQNKEVDDVAKRIAEAEAVNKMEKAKKQKQQRASEAIKNKRMKDQLQKYKQALRDEHEKQLILLRQHADEEIARLKSSVPNVEAGSSATAAGDPGFPEDSIDEINSQTPPVRLSLEEMEQGS